MAARHFAITGQRQPPAGQAVAAAFGALLMRKLAKNRQIFRQTCGCLHGYAVNNGTSRLDAQKPRCFRGLRSLQRGFVLEKSQFSSVLLRLLRKYMHKNACLEC
jgi:hypothetical protein